MLKTQIPRSFRTLLLAVSIEPQEIGKRIRAARERRGWTQMDFANEAHVSMSSVQRWERGDLPPVRELIRLSGVLGVDPEQLVELEPTGEDQLSALGGELVEVRQSQARQETMLAEILGKRARRASPSSG